MENEYSKIKKYDGKIEEKPFNKLAIELERVHEKQHRETMKQFSKIFWQRYFQKSENKN